jgi:sulfur carrier protein
MNVTINGESRTVEDGTTLQALLDQMEVQCEALVVQRNDDIVGRDAFTATQLADGDLLELVRFVGGG